MDRSKHEYERIGLILREARERAGLSQTEVLRRLGQARTGRLSNIEAGNAAPTLEFLLRCGDVVGVEVRLIAADGEATHADNLAAQIMRLRITPSRVRTLKAILDSWETEDQAAIPEDSSAKAV